MPPIHIYDTTGRKCTHFFGEPCPGRGIFNKEEKVGCPEWQAVTMEPLNGGAPLMGEGCYRLMDMDFMTGFTKRIHGAAAAVESNRNEIVRGMVETKQMFEEGFSNVARVIIEATHVQNEQLKLDLNPHEKLMGIGPL